MVHRLQLIVYLLSIMALGCTASNRHSVSRSGLAAVSDVSLSSLDDYPTIEPEPVQLVSWHAEETSDIEGDALLASGLDLASVVRQAFQSNPEIRLAHEGTHAANAALRRAQVEFKPLVTTATGYGLSDIPIRAFSYRLNHGQLLSPSSITRADAEDDIYAQLQLQKDVYDGGKRAAQARAATALRAAATHEVCSTRNEIAFRVGQGYYRLLKANELLHVRQQAVEQVERRLEAVRTRRDAGSAVKSDELAVVVRLAEARDAVIVADNQLELAWASLDRIVGTPVRRESLPESMPPGIGMDELDAMESELSRAFQRRPEISRLRHEQSAAANRVRAARAVYSPRVQFVGDYEVHTGDFVNGEDGFYFGVLASLDLFDGGRGDSSVAQANSSLRQKQIEYERLRLDIEFQIRQARLNLIAATERLTLADQSVEEAEEVLRNVEVQYKAETATIVRLLEAQVLAADTQARKATAEADLEIARLDLARALGMLHNRFFD